MAGVKGSPQSGRIDRAPLTGFQLEVCRERHIYEARWRCREFARALGFGMYDLAAIETAVSELASNILRHAGQGILAIQPLWSDAPYPVGVEVAATNRPVAGGAFGPQAGSSLRPAPGGSARPAPERHEGLGIGLGGVQRLMDTCHVEHRGGIVTRVTAAKWLPGHRPPGRQEPLQVVEVSCGFEVDLATRPAASRRGGALAEAVSADGYVVKEREGRLAAVLLDALGRGASAASVLRAAREAVLKNLEATPLELVTRLHTALRGTRGACVAAVVVEPGGHRIRWAGVGSVRLRLWHGLGPVKAYLPVTPGVVGYTLPPLAAHELAVHAPAVLAMASDGLAEEGLERPPATAAALLQRFARPDDDATALIIRWGQRP